MFWRWEGLNNILYGYTLKANFRGLEVHAVMTIMNIWPAAHLLLCIKNNPFTDNSGGIATRRVNRSELRPASCEGCKLLPNICMFIASLHILHLYIFYNPRIFHCTIPEFVAVATIRILYCTTANYGKYVVLVQPALKKRGSVTTEWLLLFVRLDRKLPIHLCSHRTKRGPNAS